MLFVSNLTKEETTSLQEMVRNHPLSWTRMRANAVILSAKGIPLQHIADICGVRRQTISVWLKSWEKKGLCGLVDQPRQGRPKKLLTFQEKEIIGIVKKTPRSLNQVLTEIEKRWGIKISKSTLKKLCKKANLSWKRVRKSLRGKRNDEEFYAALKEIKNLIDQCDNGEIDFYYFDESGFTLEPCIPSPFKVILMALQKHFKCRNMRGFFIVFDLRFRLLNTPFMFLKFFKIYLSGKID